MYPIFTSMDFFLPRTSLFFPVHTQSPVTRECSEIIDPCKSVVSEQVQLDTALFLIFPILLSVTATNLNPDTFHNPTHSYPAKLHSCAIGQYAGLLQTH